ncbi:heavy-metal-associated domain-containing protein [Streptomyces sp. NBC_00160]|uniref:heavy-metal-associated domain-containing protein n=1 Tax=Streptomyces sp. NBC_00160 TaxID=2903628 RepID=UPI00225BFA07|nr:heavy-metal-associated domain-containing protein [Streptomyces sp. NBC_00160]MCX5302735.1 heavy-metal-associated domain-containing protein [Streptomyces sp. NBC_00160]
MSESTYTVTGMTCGHCADSVTEEITAIGGVRKVEVDVESGRVTVASDGPLSVEDVQAAVTEAGYELVGA